MAGTVYLLHFSRRYHHAGHYMGFTKDVDERIERHRKGDGARLIEVITAAGIDFQVARTWKGNRALERRLKRRKCAPKLCPICRAAAAAAKKKAARHKRAKMVA